MLIILAASRKKKQFLRGMALHTTTPTHKTKTVIIVRKNWENLFWFYVIWKHLIYLLNSIPWSIRIYMCCVSKTNCGIFHGSNACSNSSDSQSFFPRKFISDTYISETAWMIFQSIRIHIMHCVSDCFMQTGMNH